MRILHIIPFFSPEMGGSAQVAYQMARHLGERGHSVTVVASDYRVRNASFAAGPFEVVLLPAAIAAWGFYVTPGLPRWAARNLGRFDVIHMHTVRTYQNAVVSRLAARRQVPCVLSAHGTLPIIIQRQTAKRIYDRLAGRALLASAGRLVAVSQFEAGQYREAGIEPERIRVVYNGLDLDEYAHLPPRGTFRSRFRSVSQETRIVLYLGRLHRRKGIGYLVEAFDRMRASARPSVLVIAGPDDGELARLQALSARLGLQAHIIFTGPLYGRDKLAALVDADVLASPAAHEIFGLTPFEALMCGTPVIVADECGSGQLIREAGAGYLTPYGNTDALADLLLHVLAHPGDAKRTVRAGQSYIRERLTWQTAIRALEAVYHEVAADLRGERP